MVRPNQHGVYPSDQAEVIEWRPSGGYVPSARVSVMEIDAGWISAADCSLPLSGFGEAMTGHKPKSSREAAIERGLGRIERHCGKPVKGNEAITAKCLQWVADQRMKLAQPSLFGESA